MESMRYIFSLLYSPINKSHVKIIIEAKSNSHECASQFGQLNFEILVSLESYDLLMVGWNILNHLTSVSKVDKNLSKDLSHKVTS